MKVITIDEIKDKETFSDKEIVKLVKGKITKLFNPRKGGSGDDHWEYQSGELMDVTGKIEISFSKCSQPMSAKGQDVTFESQKTDNFGWQGVKVEDSEYDNKEGEHVKKRILKITPTANIIYAGGTPQGSTGESKGETSKQQPSNVNTKQAFSDLVALYKSCYSEALNLDTEITKNPQALVAATATMFIESCRQGLAFDFQVKFSNKPPKKDKEEEKEEEEGKEEKKEKKPPVEMSPAELKKIKIPKGEHAGTLVKDLPYEKLKDLYDAYAEKDPPWQSPVSQAVKYIYEHLDDV